MNKRFTKVKSNGAECRNATTAVLYHPMTMIAGGDNRVEPDNNQVAARRELLEGN